MPTLSELSKLVQGKISGNGDMAITGVAGIEEAREGDIALVANLRGLEQIATSKASAFLVPTNLPDIDKATIKVDNPRLAYVKILEQFAAKENFAIEIHPTAVVGKNFSGAKATILPLAYVGDNVTIGDGSVVFPGAFVGNNVKIGKNTIIRANVVIQDNSEIGSNVQIHPGTVIGADGFVYVADGGKQVKVPQIGKVIIEDDVEIGAAVMIDKATTGTTMVKRGTKIDNLVQIAHNCHLGEDNVIVAQVGIAGATKLGDRVTMLGKSSAVGHVKVGDDTVVAAHSLVINSLPDNSFVSGNPARPHAKDMRISASAGRLPEVLKELKELQKKVNELEKKVNS